MSRSPVPRRAEDGRPSLFCDVELAARVERAEVRLIADGSAAARRRRADDAGFVIPIAGGVASFAEEGSPLNKVAGLGFDGVPDAADLDEIEGAFADHGAAVQVEFAHLAAPTVGALLTGRGYRLVSSENVLGRALRDGHPEVPPVGVEVRISGERKFEQWLADPDTQGVPSRE